MGGKNHQPCRNYLLVSTKLSRHLSLAYAHLELSNAALENLIIDELMREQTAYERGHYLILMRELYVSIAELRHAHDTLLRLRAQMKAENFADSPSFGHIDLDAIGAQLHRDGLVSDDAWKHVQTLMKHGGFSEVAEWFEVTLLDLIAASGVLYAKFQNLKPAILQGALSAIVEENRPGNFKIEFAVLYTQWNRFNTTFLASSLLSTELWYATTGKGSLASPAGQFRIA